VFWEGRGKERFRLKPVEDISYISETLGFNVLIRENSIQMEKELTHSFPIQFK
jgi:hypothetical protein